MLEILKISDKITLLTGPETRVVLMGEEDNPDSDYINASYVKVSGPHFCNVISHHITTDCIRGALVSQSSCEFYLISFHFFPFLEASKLQAANV